MTSQELRDRLQKLHDELGQTQCTDEHTQARVQGLQAQVRGLMECEEPTPAHLHSLRGELEEAVDEFEITHPALTWVISDALNMLSRMGI